MTSTYLLALSFGGMLLSGCASTPKLRQQDADCPYFQDCSAEAVAASWATEQRWIHELKCKEIGQEGFESLMRGEESLGTIEKAK